MPNPALPGQPGAQDWHTIDQLLVARPFLTARTVRHWCENGQVRFSKRGEGRNALRLFKLADVDAVLDRNVRNDDKGAETLRGGA